MGVPRAVVAADAELAPGSRAAAGVARGATRRDRDRRQDLPSLRSTAPPRGGGLGHARGRPGGPCRAAPASGAGAVGVLRRDAHAGGLWLRSWQLDRRVLRGGHRREAPLGLAGPGTLLRLGDLATPARLPVSG